MRYIRKIKWFVVLFAFMCIFLNSSVKADDSIIQYGGALNDCEEDFKNGQITYKEYVNCEDNYGWLEYDGENDATSYMVRQETNNPVFCVKKGIPGPFGQICSDTYNLNANETKNNALRAAIGYAINRYKNFGKTVGTYDDKIRYYAVQTVIHKILKEYNSGAYVEGDLIFTPNEYTYNYNSIYNNARDEYLSYMNGRLSFATNPLNFSLKNNNYVATITLTNNYMPTNYVITLKAGNTTLSSSYVTIKNNIVTVSIPSSALNNLNSATVKISLSISSSKTYNLAILRGCGTGYQPIAEVDTELQQKKLSSTVTGTITLDQCLAGFKDDKTSRIQLYKDLGSNQQKYGKLLDFDVHTAAEACAPANCTYTNTSACLSGNFGSNTTFNENNLSCYNDTITVGTKTGYCLTTFNLENLLGTINFSNSKAGQMIINKSYEESAFSKGTLTKTCYVFDGLTQNSVLDGKYSDYISTLSFNNKSVIPWYEKTMNLTLNKDSNNSNLFSGSIVAYYDLPVVYAKNGSGQLKYNVTSCTNCKFLGYGFVSKLTDNVRKGVMPFKLTFSKDIQGFNDVNISDATSGNACTYTTTPELVVCDPDDPSCSSVDPHKLNLEFRIIDTNNPFPGKTGSGRNVGINWCKTSQSIAQVQLVISQIMSGKVTDYDVETYDLNDDGIVNAFDSLLASQSMSGKIDDVLCSSNNSIVKTYIKNTINSYGRVPSTGETKPAKYTIKLTPDTIDSIRNYNKDTSYDDYTLECNIDGNNCKSTFLREFLNLQLS